MKALVRTPLANAANPEVLRLTRLYRRRRRMANERRTERRCWPTGGRTDWYGLRAQTGRLTGSCLAGVM